MVLMVLGINHQTAPIQIREKLSFKPEESKQVLKDLMKIGIVEEALLFSTCNRTELYFDGGVAEETLRWLAQQRGLHWGDLLPYIYSHSEKQAVKHLLRLATGLDSLVLGEVEILGQIKMAYRAAKEIGTLGKFLDRLFQYTFSVAKLVRKESGIGVNPVSVASLAVRLSDRIFSRLKEATVLLVGAGHLIRLTAEHFKARGVQKILVANRTLSHALMLKSRLKTDVLALEEIPHRLPEADIVVTGTGSGLPIIGKGMVERALKVRRHRPMYMVDLAVPRDIEPEVGDLDDVYLYCIDDLEHLAMENRAQRQQAATLAEARIEDAVEEFMGWLRANYAFRMVRALRQKFTHKKRKILRRAMQQLERGVATETVLEHALDGMLNQVLHDPTLRLRRAGYMEDAELIRHTQTLFDLEDEAQL